MNSYFDWWYYSDYTSTLLPEFKKNYIIEEGGGVKVETEWIFTH